jgi:hypothetical protein
VDERYYKETLFMVEVQSVLWKSPAEESFMWLGSKVMDVMTI